MYPALWMLVLPLFAGIKLYLGGFWTKTPIVQVAPESNSATEIGSVAESTSSNEEPIRSAGDLKVPEHFNGEDYFAMAVALFIIPIGLAMYPALWLLTLPNFMAVKMYLVSFPRPLKMIPRTSNFYAFVDFQFVAALPAMLLIAVYWVYLLLLIAPSTLLFSIVTGRIANFSSNWELLKDTRHATGFTWNGIVVGLMGAMDRQGLYEFMFYFPSTVVAVPVIKYLFTCNPLIHKLSTKHANQWTVPLELTDDQTVASALQSMTYTTHVESDRAQIDEHEFSAHYPVIPPSASPAPTSVVGVQFTTVIVNFTKTTRNNAETGLRSELGKRGIYVVELMFWNPCHMVTGYVEVNVQHDGGVEHPMWCFTGENYWGNRFYKNIDNLFWRYAPQCGGYFKTHGDADIDVSR
uniref:Uncharacterized protein n=1 Tax=Globisporangium ultimum (strain ATCC 200006 / CBS 805.95 / DAOM BR144) TaxID=431595 RepID=K3WT10_GLOUD